MVFDLVRERDHDVEEENQSNNCNGDHDVKIAGDAMVFDLVRERKRGRDI